jgi:hypothetical protein
VSADRLAETAIRCLDRALAAMNQAVEITTADGPAKGIEHIANFLNNTDGLDDDVADRTPDDWLTRWTVSPATPASREKA